MKSPIFHHAFRTVYSGVVRELITDVTIALPSSTHPGFSKEFKNFLALWDTGATHSVVTTNVINAVGLVPTGKATVKGVNSEDIVNTYIVDIGLPNRVLFPNVNVSEGLLLGHYDVIVGMDIIQAGDFSIANANGITTFSYCCPPHKNPIDLLEKSEKVNPKKKY